MRENIYLLLHRVHPNSSLLSYYQICYRNSNIVTISRDMQYTGINIIIRSNIRKKRFSNSSVILSNFTILWFLNCLWVQNFIFSRKRTVFLSTFQNVLFYYQDIKFTLKKKKNKKEKKRRKDSRERERKE